jgi:hypothetical protein
MFLIRYDLYATNCVFSIPSPRLEELVGYELYQITNHGRSYIHLVQLTFLYFEKKKLNMLSNLGGGAFKIFFHNFDDFNLLIVNFLICVAIVHHHLYMLFISHRWFNMQGLVRNKISFQFKANYLQLSLCHIRFYNLVCKQYALCTVITTIWFSNATLH